MSSYAANEAQAVDLATGKNQHTGADVMNGGWFIVRNRVESDRTTAKATSAEEALFNTFPWNTIPADHRGSSALRTQLASMLSDEIAAVFPRIRADLDKDLAKLLEEQTDLGSSRDSFKDKQQYVLKFVDSLSKQFDQALANGATKLRPKVRHVTDQFDSYLRAYGHEWEFEAKMLPSGRNSQKPPSWKDGPELPQSQVKLYEAIREQLELLQANQLPGVLNPRIYPIMYTKQTNRWQEMALHYLRSVFDVMLEESTNILESLFGNAKPTDRLVDWLRKTITDMLMALFGKESSRIKRHCKEELSLDRALLTSNPSFEDRVNKCRLLRFAEASKEYRKWVSKNKGEEEDEDEDGRLMMEYFKTMNPSSKMNIAMDVHDVLMVYYEVLSTLPLRPLTADSTNNAADDAGVLHPLRQQHHCGRGTQQ